MNWTDIEAKWAAMAKRVQTDQPPVITDLAETIAPSLRDTALNQRAPVPRDRSAT